MKTLTDSLLRGLAGVVGEGHVLTGEATVGFAGDWTGRFRGRAGAVVRPRDTAEVAAVLSLCAAPVTGSGLGVMSARTGHEAGGVVLDVNVNYLFAYAVEPPGNPDDWMRVLDHQYGSIALAQWDDPGGALEPFDQTIIGNAGIQCGTDDGYIHPDYPSERTSGAPQSGPAVNPYSSSTSVPGGGAVCGRTSGT